MGIHQSTNSERTAWNNAIESKKVSFKTAYQVAVIQEDYPAVFAQFQNVTDSLLPCVLLPLHAFFQLFDSSISPRRCQQEVLQFLGRSYYFSFLIIQDSLQVMDTTLRLKFLFLRLLDLSNHSKNPQKSGEVLYKGVSCCSRVQVLHVSAHILYAKSTFTPSRLLAEEHKLCCFIIFCPGLSHPSIDFL